MHNVGGKRAASSIIAAMAALCLLGGAASAASVAPEDSLSAEDEAALRAHMADGGITTEIQDALIARIAAGVLPDSSSGAAPVDSWTERHGEIIRTVEVFADGSRTWTDLEAPEVGAVAPRAGEQISGCTAGTGVGSWWYTNCRVSKKDAVSEAGFVVDYKITNISGHVAEVRDPRGAFCTIYAGTCTSKSASVTRAKQSGTLPARAKMTYSGKLNANAKSVSGEVWIDVHGMSRSVFSTP